MQKDYRHSLGKLAGAAPTTKAALIRTLLPGIEAALNAGQRLKDIWEVLEKDGLQIGYRVFHITVSRARKVRNLTATSGWGKQEKASAAQGPPEGKVDAVEGRDPLANLRRLEENRPGFHWRGTQSVKTSVTGKECSDDKNKR
jgi:hypothetical protein